jgi:hypothetical protein
LRRGLYEHSTAQQHADGEPRQMGSQVVHAGKIISRADVKLQGPDGIRKHSPTTDLRTFG